MDQLRTFEPAQAVVSAQGLDVSNFQGHFDWATARKIYPALAFGVFKMTEGISFVDADAPWNHSQLKANGLIGGAYHFLHPGESGVQQAQFFVGERQKLGLTASDMLWLDHETTDNLGPAAVSACAAAFMAELEKLCPHNPKGVYTYITFAKEGNCAGLSKYALWLAYPASTAPVPPPPWVRWTFWQWGTRNGIDADAFNGTKAQLDAWITSFAPPPPPSTLPLRLAADGVHSLGSLLGSTTLDRALWLMARDPANPAQYGGVQRVFLNGGGDLMKRVPPKGMIYWVG